jgi:hypothetical protein
MPYVLKETSGQQRYYGGETLGWIDNPPPPPPAPVDQAERFPDQATADKFATDHGMRATSEQVAS